MIYWGCEDSNEDPTEVTLWGVVYSIEDTDTLDLSESNLTNSIPSEIGSLINLKYLDLSSNSLVGSIPVEIGRLTELNVLRLESNQLSGVIPETVCELDITWDDNNAFNI